VADDALTQKSELPHRERADEEDLELVEDEAKPAGLFFALDTQWRRHPISGSRLGLDYLAIPPTAAMLEIPMSPQLLTDLRDMELAALNVLAARA
jgi:hypothetical protein